MRRISKTWLGVFLALFFAVAMVIIQTPGTALADENLHEWKPDNAEGTATISGLTKDDAVNLFKIADTDLDDKNQLTYSWVNGATFSFTPKEWIDSAIDPETPDQFVISDTTEAYANEIALKVNGDTAHATFKPVVETPLKPTGDEGTVNFTGLKAGLYYVQVTDGGNTTYVYQNTTIALNPGNKAGKYTVPTATAALKRSKIEQFTHLVASSAKGEYANSTTEVGRQQTAYFKLNPVFPRYVGTGDINLNTRQFSMFVTYDKNLVVGNIKIDINSVDPKTIDKYFTITPGTDDKANSFTVALTHPTPKEGEEDGFADFVKSLSGQTIAISYTGVVTGAPVPSKAGDPGARAGDSLDEVGVLTWSKDSYSTTTSVTANTKEKPAPTASLKEFGFTITKKDQVDNTLLLDGAVFDVYRIIGGAKEPTAFITGFKTGADAGGSNGVTPILEALGTGEYVAIETAAPASYVLPQGDAAAFKFTITVDSAKTKSVMNLDVTNTVASGTSNALPQTGGPGTIALTAIGVVLMVAAFVWIVRSRKHD